MHIIGEHYHVYNRGAHRAPIFNERGDCDRFVALLYAANNTRTLHTNEIKPYEMFNFKRECLVDIFSYCLMPNHFHIGLREKTEKGIEKFMRKLGTAYVKYYNVKYKHPGTLFQGKYKSKHVDSDEYLRYVIQYIHLNPFGIVEPNLTKEARINYFSRAVEISKKYQYSSFKDYLGEKRIENAIITNDEYFIYGRTVEYDRSHFADEFYEMVDRI
ncbi:MAG: transposase [Patescibacteria group bacterium]|nr:transposase [Patescibacteria group bacterium]